MTRSKLLTPGTTVGRYTIESVLGNSELCTTYRATCDGKKVVLKAPAGKNSMAEARRLQSFGGKIAGTAEVTDVFEADETVYYAMDYIEGTSLRDYVHERGKLGEDDMLALITPIIQTMVRLHARGFRHLDIKPSNIIIPADGSPYKRPMLIDFGPETSDSRVFSPGYGAPEQAAGKGNVSSAADVYALGATMLFCLTGQRPPETSAQFREYLSKALEGVSPSTASAIRKAVSAELGARQVDAAALLDDLDDDATQIIPRRRHKPFGIDMRWIAAIAVVLLCLLCWLIVTVASQPDYTNYIPIEEAEAESME